MSSLFDMRKMTGKCRQFDIGHLCPTSPNKNFLVMKANGLRT